MKALPTDLTEEEAHEIMKMAKASEFMAQDDWDFQDEYQLSSALLQTQFQKASTMNSFQPDRITHSMAGCPIHTPVTYTRTVQSLPQAVQGRLILVNPTQNGNPVLDHLRSIRWEFAPQGLMAADYLITETSAALFLRSFLHF